MFAKSKVIKVAWICMTIILFTSCNFRIMDTNKKGTIKQKRISNQVYFGDKNLEGLSEAQIVDILKKYSKKTNIEPKNASFNIQKWSVVPEINGKKLNIEKTLDKILNSSEGEKVSPIIEEVKPDITSEKIKNSIVEIGKCSTEILDAQKSRVSNIEVAGSYIDNTKIMPNEEFSFNGTLGRRTREKGYKKAPIIIKSKDGPKKGYGVGGGICQIASTLYGAALESGLKITERHPHSKKVPYVEDGKDATVVYGGADLKFINSLSNPVIIKVSVSGDKVTVKLYEIKDSQLL
jgi:vancomycin resistance protein YoaR